MSAAGGDGSGSESSADSNSVGAGSPTTPAAAAAAAAAAGGGSGGGSPAAGGGGAAVAAGGSRARRSSRREPSWKSAAAATPASGTALFDDGDLAAAESKLARLESVGSLTPSHSVDSQAYSEDYSSGSESVKRHARDFDSALLGMAESRAMAQAVIIDVAGAQQRGASTSGSGAQQQAAAAMPALLSSSNSGNNSNSKLGRKPTKASLLRLEPAAAAGKLQQLLLFRSSGGSSSSSAGLSADQPQSPQSPHHQQPDLEAGGNDEQQQQRCTICQKPPKEPLSHACGHVFCTQCIKDAGFTCPRCKGPKDSGGLKGLITSKLRGRSAMKPDEYIKCPYNCGLTLPAADLSGHEDECKAKPIECLAKDVMCPYIGPRSTMEQHIHSCSFFQLMPILRSLRLALDTQRIELGRIIQDQAAKISQLQQLVLYQEQQLDQLLPALKFMQEQIASVSSQNKRVGGDVELMAEEYEELKRRMTKLAKAADKQAQKTAEFGETCGGELAAVSRRLDQQASHFDAELKAQAKLFEVLSAELQAIRLGKTEAKSSSRDRGTGSSNEMKTSRDGASGSSSSRQLERHDSLENKKEREGKSAV